MRCSRATFLPWVALDIRGVAESNIYIGVGIHSPQRGQ
ncbi:hypothetical protein AM1_D0113 (plasmid) [Acaryochloris marina MBIC11017]|uniref:Uncharacterized protein n=1 Tax=Acaryochloris marina (strain MBIC 11017) TaxID=329726 RepID=A8ZNM3_ACAM1|nr:hypothetical protein AM1_D0113 [Acaryochloris marina MBIC11017]